MKIIIPNNNINERDYIVDILLSEFLGLGCELKIKDTQDYQIILRNGNNLIIKDQFFNNFPKDLEYLNEKNIPEKVEFGKNDFIVEDDIPIIYGNDFVRVKSENGKKVMECGIDIFASSFFMLTRWEEYVNKTMDKHNRFPAYASLAYKFNFLDRPVVNEYVEMLWNMLEFLGCNQKRKKREFKFIPTHDVDISYKYRSLFSGLREIGGDILKRKNLKLALSNLKTKVSTHLKIEKDPYDTYDYLMDVSESIGVKSYFFLHSSRASKYDYNNDRFLKKIADRILKRDHFLGYHPSYDAHKDLELFKKDKRKIEDLIGQKLIFGRQHYLRFEVPTTWRIWEDANMEWDSTLSYSDKEGFRCGVCYPYSVFNILTRKKLKLKERPLIVMDSTFVTYQPHITPEEANDKISNLVEKVKKYNGEFVFLWHNSNFSFKNKFKCIGSKF